MMAGYPPKLLRYCNTMPYSPNFSHDPCHWHWFSRWRASTGKSSPYNNARPCPSRDGVFCAQRLAKQQNLYIYSFVAHQSKRQDNQINKACFIKQMVSAKASQSAARPAHPGNMTDKSPCQSILLQRWTTPDTLDISSL